MNHRDSPGGLGAGPLEESSAKRRKGNETGQGYQCLDEPWFDDDQLPAPAAEDPQTPMYQEEVMATAYAVEQLMVQAIRRDQLLSRFMLFAQAFRTLPKEIRAMWKTGVGLTPNALVSFCIAGDVPLEWKGSCTLHKDGLPLILPFSGTLVQGRVVQLLEGNQAEVVPITDTAGVTCWKNVRQEHCHNLHFGGPPAFAGTTLSWSTTWFVTMRPLDQGENMPFAASEKTEVQRCSTRQRHTLITMLTKIRRYNGRCVLLRQRLGLNPMSVKKIVVDWDVDMRNRTVTNSLTGAVHGLIAFSSCPLTCGPSLFDEVFEKLETDMADRPGVKVTKCQLRDLDSNYDACVQNARELFGADLLGVIAVINPNKSDLFAATVECEKKRGTDLKMPLGEVLYGALHGFSYPNLGSIAAHGVDGMRYSNRTLYGWGSYFTPEWQHAYAYMSESGTSSQRVYLAAVGELIVGVRKIVAPGTWNKPFPPAMEASDNTLHGVNVEGQPFSCTVSNAKNSIICVAPGKSIVRYIFVVMSENVTFYLTPDQLRLASL